MEKDFFEKRSEQSRVKALIVVKYFLAWANVIIGSMAKSATYSNGPIGYVDLYSGPGLYKDGTHSTPLLILEAAIANIKIRERLVAIFNDADENNCRVLRREIEKLPNVHRLKYQPQVYFQEVGNELAEKIGLKRRIPTLYFLDPWGYKGLSLQLLESALKGWGSDCIFFFNYLRVSLALRNPRFTTRMNAIFGTERANDLRGRLQAASEPTNPEELILSELRSALADRGGRHVIPFRFKRGRRTSHHLILVSKHPLARKIMTDIMAKESSTRDQGVASFQLSLEEKGQLNLFETGLDDLKGALLSHFAGRSVTKRKLCQEYELANPDKSYTDQNFRDALLELEAEGKIVADRPAAMRQKRGGKPTFGPHVRVKFPDINK